MTTDDAGLSAAHTAKGGYSGRCWTCCAFMNATAPADEQPLPFLRTGAGRGGAEGGHRGSPGRPEPAQTEFLYSIPFCTAGTASAKSMTGVIWNS